VESPQPPPALKILKRIKLEEKKRSSRVVPRVAPVPVPEEEADAPIQADDEAEEEEGGEEDLEELAAFVESEQDRLVEEILRKRRLSRKKSSFTFGDEFEDEEEEEEEVKSWYGGSVDESEGTGESNSSNNPLSQINTKPRASINTIVKERLLFHGLNKYGDS